VDLGVSGQAFVVSGGTRGLGRATAERLVAEGARVIIGGRDPETTEKAAAAIGGRDQVLGIAGDLRTPGYETQLVAACAAAFGRVDGVCISTGGPKSTTLMQTTDADWHEAFAQTFMGPLRLARATARTLHDGGSILFVLSTSVREPIAGLALSGGLRAGLGGVVQTLSDELASQRIRVNGILPGRIDTDRVRELDNATGRPVSTRREWESRIPLRRYGTPDEFGRAATFMLSPAASYITGSLLTIDGGITRSL
jgi:3-oxoacyl-[acyl-carrier protein] reductase